MLAHRVLSLDMSAGGQWSMVCACVCVCVCACVRVCVCACVWHVQVMALVREHSHEGVELVIERRNRNLVEMQPKASIRRSKANQGRQFDWSC